MRISAFLSIIFVFFINTTISYANETDYSQFFQLLKQKKWDSANTLTLSIKNPVLKKILLSQEFLDPKNSNNSFKKITGFLKQNPSWPQNILLKIQAENNLNPETNKKLIVECFIKPYETSELNVKNLPSNIIENAIERNTHKRILSYLESVKTLNKDDTKIQELRRKTKIYDSLRNQNYKVLDSNIQGLFV